jgi:hypothetical protein
MVASSTVIQSPMNFRLNQILICYCRTQLFELIYFQTVCLLFLGPDLDLNCRDETEELYLVLFLFLLFYLFLDHRIVKISKGKFYIATSLNQK